MCGLDTAPLEWGLGRTDFHYLCQPIYDAAAERYTAAELLMRMDSGRAGPGYFVSQAERGGLVGELDLATLRHALGLLERLGPSPDMDHLGVNLSPLTLERPEWRQSVLRLLEEHRALCPRLCVELTETARDTDAAQVAEALERISALGAAIAIDDFGNGQSTILRCLDVPFDVVKLDKCLVDRVEDPRAAAVLREFLGALLRMGRIVIAEGVENEVQYRALRDLGCQRFQGFYFSGPVTEEAWLAMWRAGGRAAPGR